MWKREQCICSTLELLYGVFKQQYPSKLFYHWFMVLSKQNLESSVPSNSQTISKLPASRLVFHMSDYGRHLHHFSWINEMDQASIFGTMLNQH